MLAKKMFLPDSIQVPCVNLPTDVNLGDVHPFAVSFEMAKEMVQEGKSPSLFFFVENSKKLEKVTPQLSELWAESITFWLFYPKKPHLQTDLSRDATWKQLKKAGISGTRQVGIDDNWSCMYFKNSAA